MQSFEPKYGILICISFTDDTKFRKAENHHDEKNIFKMLQILSVMIVTIFHILLTTKSFGIMHW